MQKSSLSSVEGAPQLSQGWQMLRWGWQQLEGRDRLAAVGLICLSLLSATSRGLELLVLKGVVDALLGGSPFLPLVALYGGLIALGYGAGVLQGLIRAHVDYRVSARLREQLLTKVASLPLEFHERPQFHDQLHLAGQAIPLITPALAALNELLSQLFMIGAYLGVAVSLHWSLPIAFVLGALPALLQRLLAGVDYTELVKAQSGEHRRLGYLTELLTSRATIHELWLFGLKGHLIEQWRGLANRLRLERFRRILRHQLAFFLYNLVAVLGTLWGLILTVRATVLGQVSLGGLVAGLEVLYRSSSHSQQLVMGIGKLYRLGTQLQHLQGFLALAAPAARAGRRLAGPIQELRLEGVGFTYPGAVTPTLCNVTCTLRAGERIALVGANGAGKSTLAALLLGLYQPTQGRLLVNGIDSRELAPGELWRHSSAIYQDFERFELTLGDNLDPAGGGAAAPLEPELLAAFPEGAATPLGKRFGGAEPSLGQWQRLALLRALRKPASLLVLDEPTASLDPEAEVALFEQVLAGGGQRLTVMISHRLGVCRLADRILVLEQGQLVEEGTHLELVEGLGRYQEIYAAQAAWYQ